MVIALPAHWFLTRRVPSGSGPSQTAEQLVQDVRRATRKRHAMGGQDPGGPVPATRRITAKIVRQWLANVGVTTPCIESDRPLANGYGESFSGKGRDQLTNAIFYSLGEARVLIDW